MPLLLPQTTAALKEKPAVVLFSAGKDAIATCDILHKEGLLPNVFVYFYFVAGISFVESVLRYYERLWSVTVLRRPSHSTLSLAAQQAGARKTYYSDGDALNLVKKELGEDTWFVSGAKRSDSLARRGMFSKIVGGVDNKRQIIYPIIDWSDRQVTTYCKANKLKLPITYDMGNRRSVSSFRVNGLVWLKGKFPKDYARVIKVFPHLESLVFRYERQYARK